ncbi:MAG: SH3 domain-containing protein, partial [Chloroflexota bacterium]
VSGLRVHSYPSLNAGVVTSVSTGQRVQVLARRNGWMKIRTATGQIGWVVSRYTSRPGRAVRSARSRTFKSYVYHAPKSVTRRRRARRAAFTSGPVLTAGVRVHAAPGLKARVIGLAAAGTHVRVLGYISGWVLVRFASGKTGYVYGAYVRA